MVFDREEAKELISNTSKTIKEIASILGCKSNTLHCFYHKTFPEEFRKLRKKACYRRSKLGDKNAMKGVCGQDHPRWEGDCPDGKGYIIVLKPSWFTGRPKSKYIFKHHHEYCKVHKLTEIPIGCCIHHKDFNPLNNKVDNLELMTNSQHSKLHNRRRLICL